MTNRRVGVWWQNSVIYVLARVTLVEFLNACVWKPRKRATARETVRGVLGRVRGTTRSHARRIWKLAAGSDLSLRYRQTREQAKPHSSFFQVLKLDDASETVGVGDAYN